MEYKYKFISKKIINMSFDALKLIDIFKYVSKVPLNFLSISKISINFSCISKIIDMFFLKYF